MVAIVCGSFFGALLGLIVGGIIGFYATKKYYDKSLKENPPITEDQIRYMYAQMGRKPTEKQIRAIMYNMKHPNK